LSSPSAHLVEYLVSLAQSELEPAHVERAKLCLLDNIGCGLYGSRQPWGRIVNAFALSEASRGTATLYGSDVAVAPARAALANGTSTHGFEIDDIIHGHSHPGAVVVSSALAAAEHVQASGRRLLAALVAGYEMMDRLGSALGLDHSHRGFHTTGIAGPVASAVAAGIVMELDSGRLLSAIGNACSGAAGIKAFTQGTGGMAKRMHAGRAAEAGLVACELAARGFTGPLQGIDGRFGLLEVVGGAGARPELLDRALGSSFAIDEVWVKVYPCCGAIHSALSAVESLKREHGFSASQIAVIRVHTNQRCVTQNAEPDPQDTMGAQYSIPFCMGVAVAGDARNPAAFSDSGLRDTVVRDLARRTTLALDPEIEKLYPDRLGARVAIELADGRKHEATVLDPPGSHADPCAPPAIENKFRLLAASVKSSGAIDRIIEAVRQLPDSPSVTGLSGALRENSPEPVGA
jgi:2-methylcitrate dehydratase PrpD